MVCRLWIQSPKSHSKWEDSMGHYPQAGIAEAERAAAGGTSEALYQLGLIYSTGNGVPQDYVIAHKWFNLAAMNGSREARGIRAEIARDMTPEQIAEAQRLAREWRQTH